MTEDIAAEEMRREIVHLIDQLSRLGNAHETLQQRLQAAENTNSNLEHRMSQHLEARLSEAQLNRKQVSVKPPRPQRFKGNVEGPRVLEWVHQAETYLLASSLELDTTGVYHIASFFDADAAVWWRHYCAQVEVGTANLPRNWKEMKDLIRDQFQIFNFETEVRDKFTSIRQFGSVSNYITRFRALAVELPNESEANKIYQFLKGLKPEIQARTRTHKPTTLTRAMDIADEADRANYHAYGQSGKYAKTLAKEARSIAPAMSSSGPAPMQIGAIANAADTQRLRQENRCFYCRKSGHQAKQCPKKKSDYERSKKKKGGRQKFGYRSGN